VVAKIDVVRVSQKLRRRAGAKAGRDWRRRWVSKVGLVIARESEMGNICVCIAHARPDGANSANTARFRAVWDLRQACLV